MVESARLNGEPLEWDGYGGYHRERIERTLAWIEDLPVNRVLEIGSHPWAMTAALVASPGLELVATVSAEEHLKWPDDVGVRTEVFSLVADDRRAEFTHYVGNVERTRFSVAESPDLVLACEIIEHLIRAPHVLLLNANQWLSEDGWLVVTTPNGGRFRNPLPVRSPTAGYRSQVYSRHSYLFTLPDLADLIERCGFDVVRAEYWALPQSGSLAKVKQYLGRAPNRYLQAKFRRGVAVLARKVRDAEKMSGVPTVYDGRGDWEYLVR